MRLVRLSTTCLILCMAGLLALLLAGIDSARTLHLQQSEVSRLLTLKSRIDNFSTASDSLLLYGADSALWQAYLNEARSIQAQLQQLGMHHPDALKAMHRIDIITDTVRSAIHGDANAVIAPERGEAATSPGPLHLSFRSNLIISHVANHGVALDTVLVNVIDERIRLIKDQVKRAGLLLAAMVMLFALLALFAFFLIHHRIVPPLREFVDTIEAIRRGNTGRRAGVGGSDELGEMAVTLNSMLDDRMVYEGILHDQQQTLIKREALLAESQRIASLGSWHLDLRSNRLQWSDETYRMLGVSADSFTPDVESFLQLVHPQDRDKLMAERGPALAGRQPHDVVVRIVRPDGEVRYMHERAEARFDEAGNAVEFSGTIQDITERKQLDARLLQYNKLVEGSTNLCGICNADYTYLYVNRAYCEFFGVDRPDIEGHHLREVLGEAYFDQEVKPRVDRSLDGDAQQYETTRVHSTLGRRYLLASYFPIESTNSTHYVAAVITDITELKKAESALEEQSRLLTIAGRMARLGGWSVDLASGAVMWSDTVAEIHGMQPGYRPTVEEAIHLYTPEYRERIEKKFRDCSEHGEPYDEVVQIINTDNVRIWVRTSGEPVYDHNGKITKVQGACQDITEHQDMLVRLEEQTEVLGKARNQLEQTVQTRQALINSLPAHIALLDAEGTIMDVNEQWRHFGKENAYSGNDFGVGTNYINLCERSHGECADEAMAVAEGLQSVLDGDSTTFALEYPCHAPGEQRWFRVMANRLGGDTKNDKALGMVVMHIDITERKLAELELQRLAYEDKLTGVLSRNGFVEHLAKYIDDNGWQTDAMVVLLDLVGLHDINDAHGYSAGDTLLRRVAERLQQKTELVALIGRTGGDEFTIFVPGATDITPLQSREQLDSVFMEPFNLGDDNLVNILGRFGYTCLDEEPRAIEVLLREAELALFHSRMEGIGEHWSAYTGDIGHDARQRRSVTRELHHAIEHNEFELHFQPKVNLVTGEVVACEALIRWNHPQRGMQSPGLFIPIAEKSQLIRPIGEWVLNESCRYLRLWMNAGLNVVRVSVNVSMIQFIDEAFINKVSTTLLAHDIQPHNLTLEITESVFENHTNILNQKLHTLHEMGIRTSLDDFGTGYSSLRYLQQFPFDEIKIDQGFVRKMLDEKYSQRIVTTIISIAEALDAEVVAEGIENPQVSETLLQMGCRVGQGYYYSVPMAAEDFHWLLEQKSRLPLITEAPRPGAR